MINIDLGQDLPIADVMKSHTFTIRPVTPPPTISADLWGEPKQEKIPSRPSLKRLVAKLRAMDPDTELLPAHRRSYYNNGSRSVAASTVLGELLDLPSIGHSNYCTKRGQHHKSPRWLVGLFVDIEWSVGAIHAGDVLQHIARRASR